MNAAVPVGFGIVGARSMVATRAVMPAIDASSGARLAAVAALGGPVDRRWSHLAVDGYDDVLAHPDVDAVYVPLPNGLHREWVERAAAAGKHVLCEKPIAPSVADAAAMVEACDAAGVVLAEAWMTPFDARWRRVVAAASDGELGAIVDIDTSFTFTIGPEASDNYRWSPDQGGGALLDVGIYCLGPIVALWGAEPDVVDGHAHTGGTAADAFVVADADGRVRKESVVPSDPYLGMVDTFAAAVRGETAWPRPMHETIELLRLLERISEASR